MITVGTESGDVAYRSECARLLDEVLAFNERMGREPGTRKALQRALLAVGVDVSLQAMSMWFRGETLPKPTTQAALAYVLGVPHRALFPSPTFVPTEVAA